MKIEEIIWDQQAEEHIWRHRVLPEEVEDVCFSKHFTIKSGRSKYAVWGQTSNGRYILVILATRGNNSYYPVTAREMDNREKRQYKKWHKK